MLIPGLRVLPLVALCGAVALSTAPAAAGPGVTSSAAVPARPSRRAWIGVGMAADRGGPGVRVTRVSRAAPADRAGVRVSDRIVAVDNAPVATPEQVSQAVAGRPAGAILAVSVLRDGVTLTLSITSEARPPEDSLLRREFVGGFAPEWEAVAPLTGAPGTLAALRGRVVIVDFWASFCGPCRFSMPALSALSTQKSALGLSVVGITSDGAEAAAVTAMRLGVRYPIVLDPEAKTAGRYFVSSLPTLFVIDRRGVIRHVQVGVDARSDAQTRAVVDQLLAEPAP